MDIEKLKAVLAEAEATVNIMHGHFKDLDGASFGTCLAYGECVGLLHNAATMLGRDIAGLTKEQASVYKPGYMLSHDRWDRLLALREKLNSHLDELVPAGDILTELSEVMRTALTWRGGDPE